MTGMVQDFKGSPDQNHFIFELNVGNCRIRHWRVGMIDVTHISIVSKSIEYDVIEIQTLISKIKWLGSELLLRLVRLISINF